MDDRPSFSLGFTQETPICLNPQPTPKDPKEQQQEDAIEVESIVDTEVMKKGSFSKTPIKKNEKKKEEKEAEEEEDRPHYPTPNTYERCIFENYFKNFVFLSEFFLKNVVDFCGIYVQFIHNYTLMLFVSHEIRCIRSSF